MLYQIPANEKILLHDALTDKGVLLGIKVDTGLRHLNGSDAKTYTSVIDKFLERCTQYAHVGALFRVSCFAARVRAPIPSIYARCDGERRPDGALRVHGPESGAGTGR